MLEHLDENPPAAKPTARFPPASRRPRRSLAGSRNTHRIGAREATLVGGDASQRNISFGVSAVERKGA